MVTDSSWKCKAGTSIDVNEWARTNFNDVAWRKAYVRNDNSGSLFVPGIPANVHWISPVNRLAHNFMCRRRFGEDEKDNNNSRYRW